MPDPTRREAARTAATGERVPTDVRLAVLKALRGVNGADLIADRLHETVDDLTVLAGRLTSVVEVLQLAEQAMAGEPEDFGPRLNTLLDDLYRLVPEAASPPGDDRPPEQRVVAALQRRLKVSPLNRADVGRAVTEALSFARIALRQHGHAAGAPFVLTSREDWITDQVWSRLTEGRA